MIKPNRPLVRRLCFQLLLCLLLAACSTQPTTTPEVATPSAAIPTIEVPLRAVSFETEDGVTLSGTLFGQGPIGIVLSHTRPTDQKSWHAFARLLAENGYLALAYDFRGYGASGGARELGLIDRDVRAALLFANRINSKSVARHFSSDP